LLSVPGGWGGVQRTLIGDPNRAQFQDDCRRSGAMGGFGAAWFSTTGLTPSWAVQRRGAGDQAVRGGAGQVWGDLGRDAARLSAGCGAVDGWYGAARPGLVARSRGILGGQGVPHQCLLVRDDRFVRRSVGPGVLNRVAMVQAEAVEACAWRRLAMRVVGQCAASVPLQFHGAAARLEHASAGLLAVERTAQAPFKGWEPGRDDGALAEPRQQITDGTSEHALEEFRAEVCPGSSAVPVVVARARRPDQGTRIQRVSG
jgi:hypothetical protein